MKDLGIDVSSYQPRIDWARVAFAGVKVAYIKSTEGGTYKNPLYSKQLHGAEQAGLRVGQYHFYRPRGGAADDIKNFLRQAGWHPSWLPPALDIEVTDDILAREIVLGVRKWLEAIEDRTGVSPLIYVSPGFWGGLGNPVSFSKYPLWVAHYGVKKPSIPPGWSAPAGWQYTSKGLVSGIEGRVDLSAWYSIPAFASGDEESLPLQPHIA